MASNNILDLYFVQIFPHMPPVHQREGIDILKAECAKIEGAGSVDEQLAKMGQSDVTCEFIPEDKHKAMVAIGLDQCYWQLCQFLHMSHTFLILYHRRSTHFSYITVFKPFTNSRSSTLSTVGSCSLPSRETWTSRYHPIALPQCRPSQNPRPRKCCPECIHHCI